MIKKILNKETLFYLIFGILTTLINIIVFKILRSCNLNILISNTIAWVGAILFAYITNKKYVFESKNKSKIEFFLFFSSRLFSLVIDNIFMIIFIKQFLIKETLAKIIINIIVIIINYILSKFLIFKNKK